MADKKISQLTAATTPLDGTEVLPIVQSTATVKVANNDLRPKQIQSNATSGVLQVVGPAAGSTRVMTVPNANFTAARTDAAQSFTGTQTTDGSWKSTNETAFIGQPSTATLGAYGQFTNTGGTYYVGLNNSSGSTFGGTGYAAIYYHGGNYPHIFYINGAEVFRYDTSGNLVPKTAAKGVNFTANTALAGMTSQLLNWYEEGTYTPTATNLTVNSGAASWSGKYTRVGRLVTVYFILSGGNFTITQASTTISLPYTATGYETGLIVNPNTNIGNFGFQVASGNSFGYVGTTATGTGFAGSVTYMV